MSVETVLQSRQLVLSVMQGAMKDGHHFGKIPGCGDKPTLLQPGAQMLCSIFRLTPQYQIEATDLPNGHREYRVICTLLHPSGQQWQGLGCATTMESKHRFRNAQAAQETKPTGDQVPKWYWDMEDKKAANSKLREIYDGKPVKPLKVDGKWEIVFVIGGGNGEKIENQNPADQFNTVLKMAKKRAYVDATISATACADMFTQDLEDLADEMKIASVQEIKTEELPKSNPDHPKKKQEKQATEFWDDMMVSEAKFKDGESNGKKYRLYTVLFTDGRKANTFSETTYNEAVSTGENGQKAKIGVAPGKLKDSWELVSVESIFEEQK